MQKTWTSSYAPFNAWRAAIEAQGVLVFQIRDVDVEETRGFSIAQSPLPVVAANIKDAPSARAFTLLHEYTHLLLRRGGLCDLHDDEAARDEGLVEVFCNRVAGAVLVPGSDLLAEPIVLAHRGEDWSEDEVGPLARAFGVSREVVFRRLLILGRTSQRRYEARRQQYAREFAARAKVDGFAPPHRLALSTAGKAFVSLVLRSFHQEKINSSDLAEYLGVRLKHLPKIEDALARDAS
jgi:Zn-dependent peptidase ImmA (M78 family)